MTIILRVVSVGVLAMTSFFMGKLTSRPPVELYKLNEYTIAVHRSSPGYGLPVGNYRVALSLLRGGKTDDAIERLETFLDRTVYDAKQRWNVLDESQREALAKILQPIAQYRSEFPRPISDVDGVYWTAARLREVDDFLSRF